MSYWNDDVRFLERLAEGMPPGTERRWVLDIARDLGKVAPDGVFLEELAGKIECWSEEGVTPTREYAEKLGEDLRSIGLALKKDPSQLGAPCGTCGAPAAVFAEKESYCTKCATGRIDDLLLALATTAGKIEQFQRRGKE